MNYMVAPGARLALGTQDNSLSFAFQEGGSSAMTELLMKARSNYQCQNIGWAEWGAGWASAGHPERLSPAAHIQQPY